MKKILSVLSLFCGILLFGCDNERPVVENYQVRNVNGCISTTDIIDVGFFSAVLQGKIEIDLSDKNDYTIGFELSTDSLFTFESTIICVSDSVASDSSFCYSIKRGVGYNFDTPSIDPGTLYYVRPFIILENKGYVGNVKSFRTTPIEIITGIIDSTSYTINCKTNLFRDDTWVAGVLGVCYGISPNPTIDDYVVSNDNQDIALRDDGSFSVTIDQPLYGRSIYYRAYYNYCGKIYYGETKSLPVPYKIIDMGLSVNWAVCNVGAMTEYEFGDYYAWGETEPYYKPGHAYDDILRSEYLKDDKQGGYVISNYFDCDFDRGTYYDSWLGLRRYYYYKYNDRNDHDTLEICDDVAYVLWGGDWRMPYNSEWDELDLNSVVRDTLYHGVKGIMFTSRINKNELFVPYSGYRYKYDLDLYCNNVMYWGRDYENKFYNYEFARDARAVGLPVRPVQDKPGFVKTVGLELESDYIELDVNDRYSIPVTLTPDNATNKKVLWDTDNHRVATVDENGTILALNSGMCRVVAITEYGRIEDECLVIVNEISNNHESVNLGLSVNWAKCNLGASNPEDIGFYYLWGTPYPQSEYYYEMDFEDAASVKWGGEWRMPTIDEWTELMSSDNCSWTWTTINGVNGYKVQSLKSNYTDNWIFIPATGVMQSRGIVGLDSGGSYWSSSPDTGNQRYAKYLGFGSNRIGAYGDYRACYRAIRPVCP